MSQFAQYEVDSPNYDTTRVPFGLEIILGCLREIGIPLGEQAVLEAGCGTGNYLQSLQPVLGSLVGVDSSEQMLEQARATVTGDVELMQGNVLELSMVDESFDAVLSNQVIHHLDEGPGADDEPAAWPPSEHAGINGFLREAHRVLRPGGALVLNFSHPQQVRDGFWWADLIPAAVERLVYRLPSPDRLRQMFAAAGFNVTLEVADLHGVLQGTSYLDTRGPLKEEWRAGDSTWSLVTADELAAAQDRVEKMHQDATMDDFLTERETLRRQVGQSTFLCARK
jgi:ubiquinone/menaquinone biosynthesis C-methylase UbiE